MWCNGQCIRPSIRSCGNCRMLDCFHEYIFPFTFAIASSILLLLLLLLHYCDIDNITTNITMGNAISHMCATTIGIFFGIYTYNDICAASAFTNASAFIVELRNCSGYVFACIRWVVESQISGRSNGKILCVPSVYYSHIDIRAIYYVICCLILLQLCANNCDKCGKENYKNIQKHNTQK